MQEQKIWRLRQDYVGLIGTCSRETDGSQYTVGSLGEIERARRPGGRLGASLWEDVSMMDISFETIKDITD
jgi:hypothetical protein